MQGHHSNNVYNIILLINMYEICFDKSIKRNYMWLFFIYTSSRTNSFTEQNRSERLMPRTHARKLNHKEYQTNEGKLINCSPKFSGVQLNSADCMVNHSAGVENSPVATMRTHHAKLTSTSHDRNKTIPISPSNSLSRVAAWINSVNCSIANPGSCRSPVLSVTGLSKPPEKVCPKDNNELRSHAASKQHPHIPHLRSPASGASTPGLNDFKDKENSAIHHKNLLLSDISYSSPVNRWGLFTQIFRFTCAWFAIVVSDVISVTSDQRKLYCSTYGE